MKQYKHNTITKAQRVVAYILFTCQLLSSCGGREETIIPTIASSKQDEQCIEKDDFTTIISPKEDAESSSLTNQLPDDGIQEYSASLQPVPLSFSTNDKDCCEDEQKESEEDDYEWEWLTQDKLAAWCYSLAYKKQQEGPQQGYSDKSDTPKSIFSINSYDRNKAYHDFIDHESSIISANHSTSWEYSFDHFEPKCYSFEDLSVEEKTASLVESIIPECDLYHPFYVLCGKIIPKTSPLLFIIKNGFSMLKQQFIDERECQLSYLAQSKLNMKLGIGIGILIVYKGGNMQLLKTQYHKSFTRKDFIDELYSTEKLVMRKENALLVAQRQALRDEIKEKSSLLNQSPLLDSELLTQKIREYIDHYNDIVSEKDRFTQEEIDNFCNKIVQYTTYEEVIDYLTYDRFWKDFSDTVHRYYKKVRYLSKLKRFIRGINPEINPQSEQLIKLKLQLKIVQQTLSKHNYFFEKGGMEYWLLSQAAVECKLLEALDLSTQDLKKDKAIDKVYMLVYASDDICNACTNAIPKIQSLLSEKFHQQGVTVDPSDVDVLYLPISEKREVNLDKLIMKRIK